MSKGKENNGRYTAPKEHSPDGEGLFKAYKPAVGATFIMSGAEVRSGIDAKRRSGIVSMDLGGKWNHAAKDTLSIITSAEQAREFGEYLIEAADAAVQDEAKFKELFK